MTRNKETPTKKIRKICLQIILAAALMSTTSQRGVLLPKIEPASSSSSSQNFVSSPIMDNILVVCMIMVGSMIGAGLIIIKNRGKNVFGYEEVVREEMHETIDGYII